eukprot:tig00000402_g231.t1
MPADSNRRRPAAPADGASALIVVAPSSAGGDPNPPTIDIASSAHCHRPSLALRRPQRTSGSVPPGLLEVAQGSDLLFHLLSRGLDDLEPAAASAASALVLAAAERLDGAGRLAAALGPLDAWVLARAAGEVAQDDGFENRAALPGPGPFGRLGRALEQRLSAPDRLRHLTRALFSGAECPAGGSAAARGAGSPLAAAALADGFLAPPPPPSSPAAASPTAAAARARAAELLAALSAGDLARRPVHLVRAALGAVLAALAAAPERDAASRSPGALVAECGGAALGAALAFLSDREEGPAPGCLRAAAARAGDARECAAVRQEALACVANYVAASWVPGGPAAPAELRAALDALPLTECLEAMRDEAGTPGRTSALGPLAALLQRATHERRLEEAHRRVAATPLLRDSPLAASVPWAGPAAAAAAELGGLRAALAALADEALRRGGAAVGAAVAQRTALLTSAAAALGEAACGAEARAPLAAPVGNLLHRCPEARAALGEAGPAAAPALLRGACAALEGRDRRAQLAACQLVATLTAEADAAMRRVLDGREAGEAEPQPRPPPSSENAAGGGGGGGGGGAGSWARGSRAARAALRGVAGRAGEGGSGSPAAPLPRRHRRGAGERARGLAHGHAGGARWPRRWARRGRRAELVLSLALLKNLAAGSGEAKAALLALRVAALLERLWPLAAREGEALQVELLGLLAGRARLGVAAHGAAFAALASMALVPEFRAALARTAFLADCAAALDRVARERAPASPPPPAPGPFGGAPGLVGGGGGRGGRAGGRRAAGGRPPLSRQPCLLTNEGQLAIVRTPGLVAHAVELLEERRGAPAALRLALRAGAALLLRNLAFLQEAKPHILAPEMALPRLLAMVKVALKLKGAGVGRALLAREAELSQRPAAAALREEEEEGAEGAGGAGRALLALRGASRRRRGGGAGA